MAENDTQKEQDIRKVLSSFVDIWNRNDVRTPFGKLFTSDADFVVLSGTYLKGRDEIVAHHIKIRADVYGDSHLVWNPIRVKFVRSDVAVAEVATEITLGKTNEIPSRRLCWSRKICSGSSLQWKTRWSLDQRARALLRNDRPKLTLTSRNA